MIYGVAVLALCMFMGQFIGNLLGLITGTNSDIGGVGFAMLLLLVITNFDKLKFTHSKDFGTGISFWKNMYIPVVIAMTASQNVFQAVSSGALAIVAGLAAVAAAFIILFILNKATAKGSDRKSGDRL